jgi:phosphatidylinositol-3-phosphatase
MIRRLPRWLYVLFGLINIVIVGSVVFFTTNLIDRATPSAPLTVTAQKSTTTVFMILMENHNWSDIKNNPSASYINNSLLPMASHAEQYYNPPGIHPSEPNYLWLEAGTNFGINNDADPYANHQSSTKHLVTLLNNAHISWKSYQENISGTACPLTGNSLHAPKHNPMVFFDDITNSNDPNSPYCIAHVRPYIELAADLQQQTQARYNFITPNQCDDMHSTCAPTNDSVKQGDTWLAQNLPAILNSAAYMNGGIVFITWDEGEGGDGPIGMIVLSPDAKGGGYSNTIHYTHSSTLRTLEEIFGVTPLLGDAAHAADLRDLFKHLV